jgi:hypothetical protein
MPLSLHTATRRHGKIRGAGEKTLRDASSRATKAFYPALSLRDPIFSGVFERHPRLRVAIVEFELRDGPYVWPPSVAVWYNESAVLPLYSFEHRGRKCRFSMEAASAAACGSRLPVR